MERLVPRGETSGGASTANPRVMAQALRARQSFDRPAPAQGARGALDYAAGVTAGIPVIGDLLGLGRDVAQFQAEPESRTPMNVGLAALGLIPFVPPAVSYGLGKLAKSRGVEIAPPPAGPAASQAGAIVYHGSPHKFDAFDSSKIGTGEGAQAYGHGLYLAESPGVAKSYAENLSRTFDASGDVAKYWRNNGGETAYRAFAKNAGLSKQEIESVVAGINNTGTFYKVDLPDPMIGRMLDWDKPVGQQNPRLDNWFNARGEDPYQDAGALYNQIAREQGSSAKAAEYLRRLGIPGIRYLDGGSRGVGEGTSNFVVFPGKEQNLRILERNGQLVQPVVDALRRSK